jgi:hypothetical protein
LTRAALARRKAQTYGIRIYFAVWQTTLCGVVGYRALAVNYSHNDHGFTNNLDLILHGPVAGLSFRW